MMNILFLVESRDNQTASNLIDAFNEAGQRTELKVDVVPYHENGVNQCVIGEHQGRRALFYKDKPYFADDYQAAVLWSWGTATLGRYYLRFFENQGVKVLNSCGVTEVTDSKIRLTTLFEQANVPVPHTLYSNVLTKDGLFEKVEKALGAPPYVFKADYGTRGQAVQFAYSVEELRQYAAQLEQASPEASDFIVQQFIGDSERPICHYRVLVIGDAVLPYALKVTATEPMKVSNIAAGATVEMVAVDDDLKQLSLKAAQVSGLNVAGVDLMSESTDNHENAVVLEINDGPGTKTFDRAGFNASSGIVDYFINRLMSDSTERAITKAPITSVGHMADYSLDYSSEEPRVEQHIDISQS